MGVSYTTERIHRSLLTCKIKFTSGDTPFMIGLHSDHHWDNPKCLRRVMRRHFDRAKEIDAPIFINGDFFCAMQGKGDRRATKSDIRPEHNKNNYLTALVKTATDWLAPYAHNIVAIGEGNHETGVLKHKEYQLIPELVGALNAKTGSNIHAMGYGYWVKFLMSRGRRQRSFNAYMTHGHGGGGPVTKGAIQTNRRAVFLPDADYIVSGHIHEGYAIPVPRFRVSQANRVYHDTQWHLCTPTFKEEFGDNSGGFHTERGRPPKPVGSYWIEVKSHGSGFDHRPIPEIETSYDATVQVGEDTREMGQFLA